MHDIKTVQTNPLGNDRQIGQDGSRWMDMLRMARMTSSVVRFSAILLLLASSARAANPTVTTRPAIHKLGTIECDMVETTPIVFQGKLYRVEYVRENYKHKAA